MPGQHLPADHSRGDANTIGGYAAVHGRPAAFEGTDGLSYSVEIVTGATGQADHPWGAYLLFVQWARIGGDVAERPSRDGLSRGVRYRGRCARRRRGVLAVPGARCAARAHRSARRRHASAALVRRDARRHRRGRKLHDRRIRGAGRRPQRHRWYLARSARRRRDGRIRRFAAA